MAKTCAICGKKLGGFLGFGGVKESDKEGVCEICREEQVGAKAAKKEKRKKEKLKRAWLYGRQ